MELRLFSRRRKAEQFEALAAREEKRVYGACLHILGNREDALDCAQETMLRAFRAFDSFRGEAEFSTWITRIAINVCRDEMRRRRDAVSLDALREETGYEIPDEGPGAYAQLEEKERLRLLREGIKALPDEMRQIIVLRDMQGRSYDEIASILSMPLGTVKSRVSRAREKLSSILRKSSELFSSTSV